MPVPEAKGYYSEISMPGVGHLHRSCWPGRLQEASYKGWGHLYGLPTTLESKTMLYHLTCLQNTNMASFHSTKLLSVLEAGRQESVMSWLCFKSCTLCYQLSYWCNSGTLVIGVTSCSIVGSKACYVWGELMFNAVCICSMIHGQEKLETRGDVL